MLFTNKLVAKVIASVAATGTTLSILHHKGYTLNAKSAPKEEQEIETKNRKPPAVKLNLEEAANESQAYAERTRYSNGAPGLVIGVSWKGKMVWCQGLGWADVELEAKCTPKTVMRIASISKSITMLLVAKLIEEGKLDLDKSIHAYLDETQFPIKTWEGEKVDITLRQLVSHLGGIRHYKAPPSATPSQVSADQADKDKTTTSMTPKEIISVMKQKLANLTDAVNKSDPTPGEFEYPEYQLNQKFRDVTQSLTLFKDDNLVAKPGTKYTYSTYGWTLISAVVEKALPKGEAFGTHLVGNILQKELGMYSTFIDDNEPIIYERSKYYMKAATGKIINAPCVDNSYKLAGGGLLSNIPDLLKFGNVMLYSYRGGDTSKMLPGYLKQSTVSLLWTPVSETRCAINRQSGDWGCYGMGWCVVRDGKPRKASCAAPSFENMAYHSGGAVGATSMLLIVPDYELVVAVFTNLQNANGLGPLTVKVAEAFAANICACD